MEELHDDTEKLSWGSHCYGLYFKGLIRKETRGAGFGVAICDQDDKLLFHMKGSLYDPCITVLEAELMALKRGLTEAVNLGITRISIYCDQDHIFELVRGRSSVEKESIGLLVDDVQRIRRGLTSSIPVMVTRNQTKFAYKLAMETLVTEIRIRMPNTCGICFGDDFGAEQMLTVSPCHHRFCVECLKQHIQVGLVERKSEPRCPHYHCKSNLGITSCAHLLTPKERAMWEQIYDKRYLRRCKKCQYVIEYPASTEVNCRCGYSFCYYCGAEWKEPGCSHKRDTISQPCCIILSILLFVWMIILVGIMSKDY